MEKKAKSLFEAISEFPHTLGIYLTYTLDEAVIYKLTDYAKGVIIILHDYQKGVNLSFNRKNGILCIPMRPLNVSYQNCFHSKLILLKSGTSARVIISSANLTKESFRREKEIAWQQDLQFDNGTDVETYNSLISYLQDLNAQTVIKNETYNKVLKLVETNKRETNNMQKFVFSNAEKSIYQHLTNFLDQNKINQVAISIKVATPFVSTTYDLTEFEKLGPINIYLRKGSKIPEAFRKHIVYQPKDNKRNGFHAKIILLEYSNFIVAFIGSANFTQQGFFQSSATANQESGIIFKTSNKNLDQWFDESYWTHISDLNNYVETDSNLENFGEGEFYAYAEKQVDLITVYLYNPENSEVYQNNRVIELDEVGLQFYKTTKMISKVDDEGNESISFKIKDEERTIAVFNPLQFEEQLKQNGESLFHPFKGIYSVKFKELETTIEKQKIKVSNENSTIEISEPPVLEQYFYNIHNMCRTLSGRKIYTDHTVELLEELESSEGPTLYKALQLAKIFNANDMTGKLKIVCEEKINTLLKKFGLDNKYSKTFLKEWL